MQSTICLVQIDSQESEKQTAIPQAATAEERYLNVCLSDVNDRDCSPNFLRYTCAVVYVVRQNKVEMGRKTSLAHLRTLNITKIVIFGQKI